jgi:hypothetical protein
MKGVFAVILIAVLTLQPSSVVIGQAPELSDVGSYESDARNARISQLKIDYRINLSDAEQELIRSRCSGAQVALGKVLARSQTTSEARSKVYTSVIDVLSNTRVRFDKRQIDVSNLDLLIVQYQQKKQEFDTAITAYQVALDDAIRVDCRQFPNDFRAALEGVRTARKQVVDVSRDIRETTLSTLKTTFDTLKLRLDYLSGLN